MIYELPEGLYERGLGTKQKQFACCDCERWMWEGDNAIIHSSRCDTPHLQPVYQAAAKVEAKAEITTEVEGKRVAVENNKVANGLSGEELVAKVRLGYLTQNEAMNTDF